MFMFLWLETPLDFDPSGPSPPPLPGIVIYHLWSDAFHLQRPPWMPTQKNFLFDFPQNSDGGAALVDYGFLIP